MKSKCIEAPESEPNLCRRERVKELCPEDESGGTGDAAECMLCVPVLLRRRSAHPFARCGPLFRLLLLLGGNLEGQGTGSRIRLRRSRRYLSRRRRMSLSPSPWYGCQWNKCRLAKYCSCVVPPPRPTRRPPARRNLRARARARAMLNKCCRRWKWWMR